MPSQQQPAKFTPEENTPYLTITDVNQLFGDDWLTDKHVNAFNKLAHDQFPFLNGFQDQLTLVTSHLPYRSPSLDFIQIINISNQHWVCASNVLCMADTVEIYDSKPCHSIGAATLHTQIAKILKVREKSFDLRHIDVQRQKGGSDCALFAMANAVTLCLGGDPHITGYMQKDLRPHLVNCFKAQKLNSFLLQSTQDERGRDFSIIQQ